MTSTPRSSTSATGRRTPRPRSTLARKELGNEAELSALLKAALRQLTRS